MAWGSWTTRVDPWISHNTICWLINNSILSVSEHVWDQSHLHLFWPSLNKVAAVCWAVYFFFCSCLLIGWFELFHRWWQVQSQSVCILALVLVCLCLCVRALSHVGLQSLYFSSVHLSFLCLSMLLARERVVQGWRARARVCDRAYTSSACFSERLWVKGMDLIQRCKGCWEVSS